MGNTSEIGLFKITQESSIGANTRRLEAVTSIKAYEYMSRMEEELHETARFLKVPPLDVSERVAKMQAQLDELEGMRKRRMKAAAEGSVTDFVKAAAQVDGYKLIVADLGESVVQGMREMWDIVKQRGGGEPFAAVLFARNPEGGNPLTLAAGTQDAVDAGFERQGCHRRGRAAHRWRWRWQARNGPGRWKERRGHTGGYREGKGALRRLAVRMRVLGLDIGEKRIGVAVADTTTGLAMPLRVMNAQEVIDNAQPWRTLVRDNEPDLLVCGLPKTMRGTTGRQAARIRELAERIAQNCGVPLEFADERLSSAEAKRVLRAQGLSEREMRGKIDSVAASLFLETWLAANSEYKMEER